MRKKTVVQIALGAALCMAAGGLLAFGRVQRDEGVKFREKAVAVQAELAKLEAMIGETEDEAEALRQRMEGAREQYETLRMLLTGVWIRWRNSITVMIRWPGMYFCAGIRRNIWTNPCTG